MIHGAHAIIYSKAADADRAFFQDILALPSVDVGGGWLIFGLPPAEIAVHPTDGEGGTHELYLMCPDIEKFVAAMREKGIACGEISDQGWGRLANITLPGGSELGVYEPRHARPDVAGAAQKRIAVAKAKKPAAKATAKAKAKTKTLVKKKATTRKR